MWLRKNGFFLAMVLILAMMIVIWNTSYFQHTSFHYIGESQVTVDELALVETSSSALMTYTSELENGVVTMKYDFYSSDAFPFLIKAPFSPFDAPLIDALRQIYTSWQASIVAWCLTLVLVGIIVYSHVDKNAVWITRQGREILHPGLIKQNAPRGPFAAQVNGQIDLEPSPKFGLLCARTWGYAKNGLLRSTWAKSVWDRRILTADDLPKEDNESGIYSALLGCPIPGRRAV